MLSDLGRRPMIRNNEKSFGDNYEMGFLHGDQEADDRERELNLYRSGSAPPTVEGSLSAIGGLFNHGDSGVLVSQFPDLARKKVGNGFLSEDDLRSDPSYSSYYYSNVNLNPRLPPPLLSKEDMRFAQRLQGGNSVIGDRRKVNRYESGNDGKGAPFQIPPGFNARKQENENKMMGSLEWENDGLALPGYGLGSKQKSLADTFHDGLNCSNNPDGAVDDTSGVLESAEVELAFLRNDFTHSDPIHTLSQIHSSSSGQHARAPASYPRPLAMGASISRSSTPDPQCIVRVPSPCPGTIGASRPGYSEKRNVNSPGIYSGVSSHGDESADLVGALSGMKLSNGMEDEDHNFSSSSKPDYLFNLHDGKNDARQQSFTKDTGHGHLNMAAHLNPANYPDSGIPGNMSLQPEIKSSTASSKHYGKVSPGASRNGGGVLPPHYGHLDSPNSSFSSHGLGGYARSPMLSQLGSPNLPPLFENAVGESAMALQGMESRMSRGANLSAMSEQNLNRIGNQLAGGILQSPFVDPLYLQYLSAAEYGSPQVAGLNYPSVDMNYVGNSYMDVFQKAHLGNLLPQQKSQYAALSSGNSAQSSPHGYFSSPTFGLSYPRDPLASPGAPNSFGLPTNSLRHNDYNMQYLGGMRNFSGSVFGPWHLNNIDNRLDSTLLEEFKSNKTRCFELSEISGHVVEFSVDQYGSRFIQQKLETATTDEKNMVFEEIFSDALTLMTDVFGNYVIQKFFEHGLANQRRELASKLFGSILTLSLQMYGCRVIQKAIEVVDMDQKIEMVKELDGHVMRCVRDQNGNHVIQKCIECVPEEHIEFIVSTFFDQVVTLSTHPYGCRVIQRVLEHCKDEKTESKVMAEILCSVSMLAQDQYGNYVVQHVLEHGKPEERSTIIQELAGKIVQMSQQKFASNVVEKCLTFGDLSERQLLVNEIIGTTDENESLQAMMKDQFANYVVQKALEICSDQQRELILTRIKVHLNALKKYTYGKHIVARVEKLVAAGERRIAAAQSLNPI